MKKHIYRLTVAGAILLASCGQQTEKETISTQTLLETTDKVLKTGKASTAIEYNDAIVGLQARIIGEMLEVLNLQGENPLADLEHLNETIKSSRLELQKLVVYEGGEELKLAADDLFAFYQRACEGPWKEAFTIFSKASGKMNEKEQARFLELLEQGSEGEARFDDAFAKAQNLFSAEHGFAIVENELQEKINE